MSRFYDALRQANRGSEEKEAQPPWGETSAEHQPTQETAAAPVYNGTGSPPPQSTAAPAEPHAPELPRPASRANPVLERTARLIPNGMQGTVVEQYRRLRTKLVQHRESHPFRTVVVTSANPNEGKTLTALNLGATFAMLPSFKVLVVDGDLRRGTLEKWLGLSDSPGFANLLDGSARPRDVIQDYAPLSLSVVTRGSATSSPTELLNTRDLRSHLNALAAEFDLVLIDSPPATVVADAHLLAAAVDAVLLVVRAFATTHKQVEKAMRDLEGFRILGTVFNCASAVRQYGRYSRYD